jgi:transcription elongation factor Elf1
MFREKQYGQGKCQACHGFHWAITLDEELNITEAKCCRCGRILKIEKGNVAQVINVGKLLE